MEIVEDGGVLRRPLRGKHVQFGGSIGVCVATSERRQVRSY